MIDGLKVLPGFPGGAVLVLLLDAGFSGGMGHGMMGGGLSGALFALVFWALLLSVVVALAVWIIGQTHRRETCMWEARA